MATAKRGSEPRPRRAAGAAGSSTPGKSKAAKTDDGDEDPVEDVRRRNREEEISGEAIPVTELRKSLYAKQVPGEFDWEAFESKGFGEGYSKDKRDELLNMYSGTVATVESGTVVEGIVVGVNDRDVILNIGFKSDGLVPLAEFKDMTNLKIGDVVDLFIEEREDAMGQLVLSRRKAKLVKGWEYVQKALDNDEVIEGFVKRRTKGGLIVDVFGIESFLPGSQIDVKPIRDFDIYVNKSIEVKVVKINYSNDNVVVSHKVLIEKDLEQQKAAILTNLEKGQVLEGVIKNMTNFGVFIDLGGVDGLLHITDISWGRINHPEEVLKLDQTVKVVVLDFDGDKKRISLGMKQLTPHPWDSLPAGIQIGSKVKGKIVNVADYGAFLELQSGVEGLIHVSEMSWSQHLRNPQDFLKVGDEVEAVVLTLDRDERKMSLGIKQLTEDPWTRQDVLTKYAVGTRHKGIVRNLTNFGLFIELEEGIDGLVHVSDLSWTKKIKHPSEFVKVGEMMEVQVLELDASNRRLALSHKHMEENPWDTFETVFTPGSVHKATVINKNDKGAILELPYGIEGFVSAKNLQKEDNTRPEPGDSLDFKVLEFSKDDRRILLSHKAMWSAEEEVAAATRKKSPPPRGKSVQNINQQSEKSTLGDIEALSALKEKMAGGAAPKAKGAEPKAEDAPKPKAEKAPEDAPESKAEKAAEPKAEKAAEAEAEKAAEPRAEKAAEAKAEEAVEPKAEQVAEAKAEKAAEAKAEKAAEPKAEKVVEPKAEKAAEAKDEKAAEPKAEVVADAKTEEAPEAKAEEAPDAKTEKAPAAKTEKAPAAKTEKASGKAAKPEQSPEKEGDKDKAE